MYKAVRKSAVAATEQIHGATEQIDNRIVSHAKTQSAESARAAVKLPEQAARADTPRNREPEGKACPEGCGHSCSRCIIVGSGGSGETGVHVAKHCVRGVRGEAKRVCPGSLACPRNSISRRACIAIGTTCLQVLKHQNRRHDPRVFVCFVTVEKTNQFQCVCGHIVCDSCACPVYVLATHSVRSIDRCNSSNC